MNEEKELRDELRKMMKEIKEGRNDQERNDGWTDQSIKEESIRNKF